MGQPYPHPDVETNSPRKQITPQTKWRVSALQGLGTLAGAGHGQREQVTRYTQRNSAQWLMNYSYNPND